MVSNLPYCVKHSPSSVNVHCQGRGKVYLLFQDNHKLMDITVPSRRDDLEAAALMFIHLLTPRGLSWTRNGVPKTDAAHDRLKQEKRKARPEDLCRGMPTEFEEFLRYCRRLKFQETPDYTSWIGEFRALAIEEGFPDREDFVWPPPPIPQVYREFTRIRRSTEPHPIGQPSPEKVAKTPRRTQNPVAPAHLEDILNGLTNLNLGERQILGDKKNVQDAIQRAKDDAKRNDDSFKQSQSKNVIQISSGSEANDSIPPPFLAPKAHKLIRLTTRVSEATDNRALSVLVRDFVEVLQSNTSRALTKEGFHFLDVLYKQLADPSVFIMPMR